MLKRGNLRRREDKNIGEGQGGRVAPVTVIFSFHFWSIVLSEELRSLISQLIVFITF